MAIEMVAVTTETEKAEKSPGVENPELPDSAIRAPNTATGTTR